MGEMTKKTALVEPQCLEHRNFEQLKLRFLEHKKSRRNGVHSLHKFYGKLIPAIPAWAIECFSQPGDLVLDPFCGSGTTLVEALLAGRDTIGVDLDPLSILISRAKTTLISPTILESELPKLLSGIVSDKDNDTSYKIPIFSHADINYWFTKDVQSDLAIIRGNIDRIHETDLKQFFLVVLSSMIRRVSLADPRLIKPSRNRYLGREEETFDVVTIFTNVARSKIATMSRFVNILKNSGLCGRVSATVLQGDARQLSSMLGRVNLIVTNPPYMAAVDYVRTNKLEGWWTGVLTDYETLSLQTIGSEKVRVYSTPFEPLGIEAIDNLITTVSQSKFHKGLIVNKFFKDMEQVFREMAHVLEPGGKLVMKISDSHYQRVFVPTTDFFILLAEKAGLNLMMKFMDKIDNYAMSTRSAARDGVVTHDWILVFVKRGA